MAETFVCWKHPPYSTLLALTRIKVYYEGTKISGH